MSLKKERGNDDLSAVVELHRHRPRYPLFPDNDERYVQVQEEWLRGEWALGQDTAKSIRISSREDLMLGFQSPGH